MEPATRTLREGELLEQLAWLRELARGLVRDASAADDLVQDAWIAAAAHAPKTDGRGLRNWLAAVARNLARQRARSHERRTRREAAAARPEAQSDDVVARGELQRSLAAAVMSLDEPQRSAVLLRYLDGLTAIEVAQRQGVTHVAARKRISRGLAELRTRLDARHGGDRNAWIVALHSWVGHGAPGAASSTLFVSGALVMFGKLVAAAVVVAAVWLGWKSFDGEASRAGEAGVARVEPVAPKSQNAQAKVSTERSDAPTELAAATERAVRLVDEQGAPRVGFTALLLDGGRWIATARSDENGRVALPGDASVNSLVVARAGFAPVRFAVRPAGDEEPLLLRAGLSVSGRLLYEGAEQLTRLELTDDRDSAALEGLDDDALRELERIGVSDRKRVVKLDDSGAFEFEGLDATWTGAIELPDGWRFTSNPPRGALSADRCLLLLEPTDGLALHVRSPLVVFGRVVSKSTREGLGGASVRVDPLILADTEWSSLRTDADGRFEVRIGRLQRVLKEWQGSIAVRFGGARASTLVRRDWVELDRTRDLGEFELDCGPRVKVKVFDEHHAPIEGALASASNGRDFIESLPTADDGTTDLATLPEHSQRFVVRADGYAPANVAWNGASEVEVLLVATNRIDVRVVTADGRAARSSPVRMTSPSTPFVVRGDRSAQFDGEFDVTFDLDDRGRRVFSDLKPGARIVLSVVDGAQDERARRELRAPGPGERLELELVVPAPSAVVRGQVVDADGRGLPRARVMFEHENGGLNCSTDADGRFESHVGAPFRYVSHLEVTRPGYFPIVRDNFSLEAEEPLEFALERGRAVDVLLIGATGEPLMSCPLLAAFEGRASALAIDLGDGRKRFECLPAVDGELQLELGGRTERMSIGAEESFVRFVCPATGQLSLAVAPGSFDAQSMVCVRVRSLDAEGDERRQYFTKRGGELSSLDLPLFAGRYQIQLESRVLGGGAPKVEPIGAARDIEIVAGKTLSLTLP